MTAGSTRPTVTFGTPTSDYFTIPKDYAVDAARLIAHSYDVGCVERIKYTQTSGALIERNRNKILELTEGRFLLMIDSDMTFRADALAKLLETAEAHPDAVVTGLGFLGGKPHYPAIFRWPAFEEPANPYGRWPDRPFEVDACGGFGMLIPRSVIDAVGPNAFDLVRDFWAHEQGEKRDLKEDFAFCRRVRLAGKKIVCDPRVKFGHLRLWAIGEADWALYLASHPDA